MRHGPRSTVPADGRALAKLIQASAATQARVRAGLRCHGATSQSEISELDAGFSFRGYAPRLLKGKALARRFIIVSPRGNRIVFLYASAFQYPVGR